jgi:2-oxoisovalerate dehydrogenase E1 component
VEFFGAALGLALEGQKPMIEIQYADFITCGFNQIVNNLATTHYRWGAPVERYDSGAVRR